MFLGSHNLNMDAKGRLAVPAKHREALSSVSGGRIVMTAHMQSRCVLVYPETEWFEVLPKMEALPSFNSITQVIQRRFIGYATPLELDGNGRVVVPPSLRQYANLDKKVVLVGLGKKFELWSEDSWLQSVADVEIDPNNIPPELQNLSL